MLFYVSKLCPCAVLRSVLAPESLMFYISVLLFSYPCLSLSKNHELTAIEFQKHERSAQCTACIGVYILEIVRSNSIHLTAAIKTLQVFTKSKENDNFLSDGYCTCNVAERPHVPH